MTSPVEDDWFFHYTTAPGLQGILSDGAFWATDANYLNDFMEIKQGIDYARRWLDRNRSALTGTCGKAVVQAIENNMQAGVGRQSGHRMFVCSFSQAGDSLSQWRAYGGGGGYAIGLHGSHLKKKARQLGFTFEKCVYKHDELDNPVGSFLDSRLQDGFFVSLAKAKQSTSWNGLFLQLVVGVMQNSIVLKGEAFSEEREWRLFPDASAGSTHQYSQDFRIRNGVFVPFVRLPLFPSCETESMLKLSADSSMPVLRLVIGPTNYKDLARDGLSKMLRQLPQRYRFMGPTHSAASYRDW